MNCCSCGSKDNLNPTVNGEFVCSNCIPKYDWVKCNDCGKYVSYWSSRSMSGRDYCEHCYVNFTYCDLCSKVVRKSEANTTLALGRIYTICPTCAKTAKHCVNCNRWTNGDKYCKHCKPYHTRITCAKCKANVPMIDAHAGLLKVQSSDSKTMVCKDCYEKMARHIDAMKDDYDAPADCEAYTGPLLFKGRAKIYYGVELEFELGPCDEMKAIMAIDFSKGDRLIKADGSLRAGIELVTMPCSLRYHKNNFGWDKLCKDLKRLGCSTEERCGLHIHMSRKITEGHEKKLYHFIYRHIDSVCTIAGRRPNNYCQVPCDFENGFDYRDDERYSVLNFTNDDTIEFRLPKGTLDHKRIYAVLEFCDAALSYTRSNSLPFIKTMPWEAFLSWLNRSDNKKKYSNLIKLLKPVRIRTRRTRGFQELRG